MTSDDDCAHGCGYYLEVRVSFDYTTGDVKQVPFLCMLSVICVSALALAADRVGSESCGACHARAYQAWRNDPHARAAQSLTDAQKQMPTCTLCHAPELAQRTLSLAQQSSGSAADDGHVEADVGCESCHGAGQYYSPSYVMRDPELARAVGLIDPGQKSCLGCHSAETPSLVAFDFAAKVKLIDHWSAEREARGQPRATNAGGR